MTIVIMYILYAAGRILYDGYMRLRRRGKTDSDGHTYSLSRELMTRDNKARGL